MNALSKHPNQDFTGPMPERKDMRIICGWHQQNFGTELVLQEGQPGAFVNHSICPMCSAIEMARSNEG